MIYRHLLQRGVLLPRVRNVVSSSSSSSAVSTIHHRQGVPVTVGRRSMGSSVADTYSVPAPSDGSTPTVYDSLVRITFLDDEGNRRVVPGIVGKTLWETAVMHGIDIGPSSCGGPVEAVRSDTWTEPLYGEGTTTGFDHVVLGGNGVDKAKPMDKSERRMLHEYWAEDELFPESRLASQIVLVKEMDGMNVYLPPRLCDDIP